MNIDLRGKHVVVTGGTGALGQELVRALVACNAHVHVPSRRPVTLERFPLLSHPRVQVDPSVDLLMEESVERFYAALPALWGAVNVAGGFGMSPILETSLDDFQDLMARNAAVCFLSSREAIRSIRKTGQGGRIVHIGARVDQEPVAGMAAYSASKSAVSSLTRTLALEVVSDGITVNAVLPGTMNTPANRAAMPDMDPSQWTPLSVVADAVLALLDSQDTVMSGQLRLV